ncbi:unnamed protein product [Paramecium primaurelia]|uniref:Uncharacterized protein n=1 Tax=Paramecium primaurelia TaxID=5886 RepID=A0A8S1PBX2_PARPR|nr:unnamed protein product [Paramecium primaurelia]CAD8100521.1 unnamed protein product [Paramecium primaurelia]CAD8100525.1 unnamed protein product [Paramecium primaurelia]
MNEYQYPKRLHQKSKKIQESRKLKNKMMQQIFYKIQNQIVVFAIPLQLINIKNWSKQNLTCPQCRADFTKVILIWKKSQLANKKTYTFKQPKQSNQVSNNIFLIQQLLQLLLLFQDIYLEFVINSENQIN